MLPPVAEALFHRLDLELALTYVLQVLRRPKEHVDEGTHEGRHQPEHRRRAHEPRILDPPPRVLVHPVPDREPEDDDEENQQVLDERPRARAEEVVEPPEEIPTRCQNHLHFVPRYRRS